jgi:hypothetical protein
VSKLSRKLKAFDKANYGFKRDTAHALSIESELTPKQLAALARSESIRAALRAKKSGQDPSKESKEFYGLE